MLNRRNGKRLKEGKTERLLDEGSLPGNGALFKTIFEKAALGIVVTDLNGRILQSNPFFQQLLGYPSEEIIGRDGQQFTHPDDVANERALFLLAMEDGQETVHLKKRFVRKDGNIVWVDLTATICRDSTGKPDFVINAIEDITDEVSMDEALRESEERFRFIFEHAPFGVGLSSPDGHVIAENKAMQEITGYPLEEFRKIPLADTFENPIERNALLEALQRDGLVVDFPVRLKRKDGTPYDALLTVSRMNIAGQHLVHTICRDVTESKRANEEIRLREQQLTSFISNSPSVFFQKAVDGHYEIINQRFADLFHVDMQSVRGKTDYDLFPKETADIFRANDLKVIAADGLVIADEIVPQDDGIHHYVSHKFPIRDQSGKIVSVAGIATDVTKYKRTEKALRENESLLKQSQQVARIGHYVFDIDRNEWTSSETLDDVFGIGEKYPRTLEGWLDIVHPDQREEIQTYLRDHVLRDKQPFDKEYRVLRKSDGTERVVHGLGNLDFGPEGNPVRMFGIIQDITEHKIAEEALRESEERYRKLVETAPDLIFSLSAENGTILTLNSALEKLTGWSPDECLGKPFEPFIHPDDLALATESYQKVLRGDTPPPHELRILTKSAGYLVAEFVVTPLTRDGKVIGELGIARSVNERKRTEEALRESQQMLQTVLDAIPARVFWKDRESRYLGCNSSFARDAGFNKPEELVGKDDFQFSWREQASQYRADDFEVITSGVPKLGYEEQQTVADGHSAWLRTSKIALRNAKGEIIGMLGTYEDITDRKRTEEALQSERNLLRTLIDNLPDAIYVKDANCRKSVVNQTDLRNMGCQSETDALGKTDFDLYPPDVAKAFYADDLSVLETGKAVINREEFFFDPEGKKRWLLTTKLPLRDRNGYIVGLVGIGHDITGRKQTEEALQHERNLLRTLIDNLPDVIYVKDANCCKTVVNQADLRNMGCQSEADALGKTDFDLYPPDVAKGFYADDLSVLETGKAVVNREEFFFDPEGKKRWLLTTKLPIRDQNGHIVGLVGIGHDITERKQTEEALTKLSSAVEQAVDGVIITTKNGVIEYVNPAWEKMTAFSKEDTIGKTPRILKSGKQGDSFYRAMWKTISNGEVWKGSLINKRKTGELFHAEVSIAPIIDENHRITHFVAIERDVTEHRQLEQQLIQALRMEGLGTLAGGVAHDFNNLLGIILGHASLLEGRRQDPTKFSRSVDAISTAVQRGSGLVRQLLTFARKTEAVLELVNANETVEELVQMLRETFPRTIDFSLDLSKDLPPISADRNQLYQALLNLCVNSRDAMPSVGTISIRTDTIPRSKLQAKHADAIEDEYVHIKVSDTGKGMDEATRSRIFEPFFTTKERGKGTGLGLSVVYGVVDSHRGFIDVESEVGRGTTFNLYFPILPLRVEPSLPLQQEPKQVVGGGETVLVVEDEEMLLESVIQVLEQKGYRVLTAKDGTEGLEVYSRHRDDIAVVLMDMGLPKLGGWEVFQKLKAVNPRVKVVLASGYIDPYIKSEMLKAGAKDFIPKPYIPEQILTRVRRVIDGK
jgi:two-component system cell cycle sensor histidine kinase/response regulator CckA